MIIRGRSVIMALLVTLVALLGGSVTAVAQVYSDGGEYPARVSSQSLSCASLTAFRRSLADLNRASEQDAVLATLDDVTARLAVVAPTTGLMRPTFLALLVQLQDLRVRVVMEGVSPALLVEIRAKVALINTLVPFVSCV